MQMLRCECHCSIWVYVGHGRQALRQCFFHSMHCPLHNQMQIKIVASKLCNPNIHTNTHSLQNQKKRKWQEIYLYWFATVFYICIYFKMWFIIQSAFYKVKKEKIQFNKVIIYVIMNCNEWLKRWTEMGK